MSSYRTGKIEAALKKKGFVKKESHHRMYMYYFDGKKTSVRTRISHGVSEYGDSLLGRMANQLKLSKRQLEDFIECPMTAEKYTDHLITNNFVKIQIARNPESN